MGANIKNYIIDASAVLAVLLSDEATSKESQKLLQIIVTPENNFYAPKLLEFEVCNGLKSAFLSKRITQESLEKILDNLNRIPIIIFDIDRNKVVKLAINKNISFYDASYLYLARTKSYQLLTLDKRIKKLL